MKKTFGKKLLSSVTAVMMTASYVLSAFPFSLGAADTLSEAEKVTLLVGNNSDLAKDTVENTIAYAESLYALGIASQFGVFLNGDFYDDGCDSEGRTAVAGTINASSRDWFDIGSGDFLDKISLESLLDNSGFAHVIAGDTVQNLSTRSNDAYKDLNGNDLGMVPKIFAYGNDIRTETLGGDAAYQAYNTELINFEEVFLMLSDRSLTLSEQSSPGTSFSADTAKKVNIPYFHQNYYASKDGTEQNKTLTGEAVFLYEGGDTDVVKFNLTSAEWLDAQACQHFSFRGIPEDAYIIISVAGTEIDLVQYGTNESGTLDRYTGISVNTDGSDEQSVSKGYYTYDDEGNLHGKWNNDEGVERILYNFYEADSVLLESAFQGTILAPGASFKGEGQGHLSGALIADNILPGTNFEFGYRPYTGPYSILGISSDYQIEVSKFAADGTSFLAGATIGVYNVNDDGTQGNLAASFVSSGSGSDLVTIAPGKYMMKEIQAPDGYKVGDTVYYFQIKEEGVVEDADISLGMQTYYTPNIYTLVEEPTEAPTEAPATEAATEEPATEAATEEPATEAPADDASIMALLEDGTVTPSMVEAGGYAPAETLKYTKFGKFAWVDKTGNITLESATIWYLDGDNNVQSAQFDASFRCKLFYRNTV